MKAEEKSKCSQNKNQQKKQAKKTKKNKKKQRQENNRKDSGPNVESYDAMMPLETSVRRTF